MQSRFLAGKEAEKHFLSMATYPFQTFKHNQVNKVWPGQYFAVYRYDEKSLDPIIVAKIKVLNIDADDNGICVQLFDCQSCDLYRVRHVPVLACGYEIGVCVPHRSYIERTIKEITDDSGKKSFYYGVSSGLLFMHREAPVDNKYDVDYMMDWFYLKDKFSSDAAYYDEINRFTRAGGGK